MEHLDASLGCQPQPSLDRSVLYLSARTDEQILCLQVSGQTLGPKSPPK